MFMSAKLIPNACLILFSVKYTKLPLKRSVCVFNLPLPYFRPKAVQCQCGQRYERCSVWHTLHTTCEHNPTNVPPLLYMTSSIQLQNQILYQKVSQLFHSIRREQEAAHWKVRNTIKSLRFIFQIERYPHSSMPKEKKTTTKEQQHRNSIGGILTNAVYV